MAENGAVRLVYATNAANEAHFEGNQPTQLYHGATMLLQLFYKVLFFFMLAMKTPPVAFHQVRAIPARSETFHLPVIYTLLNS